MALGRPSEYNENIISKANEYIESCQDTEEQVISGQSEKATFYTTKVRVNLPTIEGLALYLNFHRDTLYEWEKIHPEFSDILYVLKARQAVSLINKGLSGDYNHSISKMMLSKHGYVEKQEVALSQTEVIMPLPPDDIIEKDTENLTVS